MKKIITFVAFVTLLVTACEKAPKQSYGYNSQIGTHSNGNTQFLVTSSPSSIILAGYLKVDAGTVTVELISPSDEIVFSKTVTAPNRLKVEKCYPAEPGLWKLQYSSSGGTGEINMHASLVY